MVNQKDSSSKVSSHKEVVNILCDTALNNDWIEARNAEQRADQEECGQVNRRAYLEQIELIKQNLESARERFNTQIDNYVRKGDNCEHLDEVSKEWTDIAEQLADLESRIEAAGVEWEGRAASLYRVNQKIQLKAVQELKGIAKSSSVAVQDISVIQGFIYSWEASQYEITKNELMKVANRRVDYEKRSNFYSRSWACASLVSEMATLLQNVANGSGWAGTAGNIASELQQTKEAPAVIREDKGWPQIGDQVEAEASDTYLVTEQVNQTIATVRTTVDTESGAEMTTTKDVVDGIIGIFSEGNDN